MNGYHIGICYVIIGIITYFVINKGADSYLQNRGNINCFIIFITGVILIISEFMFKSSILNMIILLIYCITCGMHLKLWIRHLQQKSDSEKVIDQLESD